jgi:lipoprotein LprG
VRRLAPPDRSALAVLTAAVLLVTGVLAGCTKGGGGPAPTPSPTKDAATVLKEAGQKLDAAPALHFTVTSSGTPASATALTGGEGDVARPDKFSGTLSAKVGGQNLNVKVVSVGGTVWAQLLGAAWIKVDPARFGVHDPGTLLAPHGGLADLLNDATNPRVAGEKRRGAEVLREVDAEVPGATVARVLATTDPSKPVPAVFGVDEATGQLREATLTGPFFSTTQQSTYTVVLDRYGEQVDIRAPAG